MLFEDLPIIEWNGATFAVVDKLKDGDRSYLGLATIEAIQCVADRMNQGAAILFPSELVWVEETKDGYQALPAKWLKRLQVLKSQRAAMAFKKGS